MPFVRAGILLCGDDYLRKQRNNIGWIRMAELYRHYHRAGVARRHASIITVRNNIGLLSGLEKIPVSTGSHEKQDVRAASDPLHALETCVPRADIIYGITLLSKIILLYGKKTDYS